MNSLAGIPVSVSGSFGCVVALSYVCFTLLLPPLMFCISRHALFTVRFFENGCYPNFRSLSHFAALARSLSWTSRYSEIQTYRPHPWSFRQTRRNSCPYASHFFGRPSFGQVS